MKKLIGKFLILGIPILFAAILLYPTFRAAQLGKEKSQLKTAQDSAAFETNYGQKLKDAKAGQIKLGLDLQGGMYVTLEVDVIKLIEESAMNELQQEETFRQVIDETRKQAEVSEDNALDIFLKNFDAIARPKGKQLINYFDVGESNDISDKKVIEKLKRNTDDAIDQALQVIRQRIDKFGVSEPTIQKQGSRRIMLELPGVQNETEMRQLLSTTARLEFKLVRNNQDIARTFARIDNYLAKINGGKKDEVKTDSLAKADTTKPAETAAKADTANVAQSDSAKKADTANPYAGLSQEEQYKRFVQDHPFTSMFVTYFLPPQEGARPALIQYISKTLPDGEYMFRIGEKEIKKFESIINRPDIKVLIPTEYEVLLSAKSEGVKEKKGEGVFNIFGVKRESELTGDCIESAQATFDQQSNQPVVMMGMNSDGSERWATITGANIKKRIAIVLDGRVYSAPTVQNKIPNGSSQITGMANVEEARMLEIVLKAGALKAPVKIIEERVVGPSLGEDSINQGLLASLIAFILVVLFMIIYYHMGGLIADVGVLINVLIIVSILAAMGGTLTLPGIAGVILTIGMAVDANILIYERIREELNRGRSLKAAVDEGFAKALTAIIDSNVTTFITGLILFFFGTGPIKGFATTLMIGIVATLFTAITCSKAMITILHQKSPKLVNFG